VTFYSVLLVLVVNGLTSVKTHAWDQHQKIMGAMVLSQDKNKSQPINRNGLSEAILKQSIAIPCIEDEQKERTELAERLKVNAEKIPVFSKVPCAGSANKNSSFTVAELLVSNFVDEPDLGMDQDLPAAWDLEVDPKADRNHMGGKQGPTSQGFRHMYFSGGLQFPFRSMGQAPDRFNALRNQSAEYAKTGQMFWALRTRLWAIHFLQDLHQPFHVIQIPNLSMLNWNLGFKIFTSFIQRSTQSMANYHYAYEALALEWVSGSGLDAFQDCFQPNSIVLQHDGRGVVSILDVVLGVKSLAKSASFGSLVTDVFDDFSLKSADVNLPEGIGGVDVYALTDAVEPNRSLEPLKNLTCSLFQQMMARTEGELQNLFQMDGGTNTSSRTGK
jgi:hypothetical protein